MKNIAQDQLNFMFDSRSRFGESDGYDKRLRLGAKKTDPLVEDPDEDLYEVIRSESDESSDSSSSSICDVYVNKYMASEQVSIHIQTLK